MHRLYASSFPVIHIHAATMTISDLSMIWVNISPLYFCFISLFFEPLVLPYGSVYCFKFKICYSRFYWSRSTKDPQPSLVCRCGFFRPSQVWVNIPKRKFRTELMHFSQSLPRARRGCFVEVLHDQTPCKTCRVRGNESVKRSRAFLNIEAKWVGAHLGKRNRWTLWQPVKSV